MDPETLVRTTDKTLLSEADLEAGRRLIDALGARGIEVAAAFWLLLRELRVWRLYLASRYVEAEGPLKFYQTVEDTLRDQGIPISMWDIAGTNTKDPQIRSLVRGSGRGDQTVSRIGGGTYLGKDFEEACVYVMDAAPAAASS